MNGWQDIAALACVALAVAYILWRAARKLVKRSNSSCGGCGTCPTGDKAAREPQSLVALKPPKPEPRDGS